jgi:elongation factor P hydroxylase
VIFFTKDLMSSLEKMLLKKNLLEKRFCEKLCHLFEKTFFCEYKTLLKGGFEEPFYKAPSSTGVAEIQFTRDYCRSALHEISHWCVAGESRRSLDDFGYWYEPDGRSWDQQTKFFEMEVLPQAYEAIFCAAMDLPFDVSVDNLDADFDDELEREALENFRRAVEDKSDALLENGLPKRVEMWQKALLSEVWA